MIAVIKKVASIIFDAVSYKFNAGDISFSIWDVIMTVLLCVLVGYILKLIIRGIAEMGDD